MKRIIVILIVLCVGINANAQIGIIAGINSTASDIQTATQEIKRVNQYHLGLTWNVPLVGNFLALQPSIIYKVSANSISGLERGEKVKLDFSKSHFQVPVALQAGLGISSILRVYAYGEPFVGLYYNFSQADNDFSLKSNSFWYYGFGLGAGVELFNHLQVSARYVWNLGIIGQTPLRLNYLGDLIKSGKADGVVFSLAILL